jgi:hypothetical protein
MNNITTALDDLKKAVAALKLPADPNAKKRLSSVAKIDEITRLCAALENAIQQHISASEQDDYQQVVTLWHDYAKLRRRDPNARPEYQADIGLYVCDDVKLGGDLKVAITNLKRELGHE